jgi:hypothetical protein
MMPPETKTKCPLCPKKFEWAIALASHQRKEHPDNYELIYPFVRRMRLAEGLQRKIAAEAASHKTPPQLVALYKHCPCGKSFEAHMKVEAANGRKP